MVWILSILVSRFPQMCQLCGILGCGKDSKENACQGITPTRGDRLLGYLLPPICVQFDSSGKFGWGSSTWFLRTHQVPAALAWPPSLMPTGCGFWDVDTTCPSLRWCTILSGRWEFHMVIWINFWQQGQCQGCASYEISTGHHSWTFHARCGWIWIAPANFDLTSSPCWHGNFQYPTRVWACLNPGINHLFLELNHYAPNPKCHRYDAKSTTSSRSLWPGL